MNDFLYVLPSLNPSEALPLPCKIFDGSCTQGAISPGGKRAKRIKDISAYIPDITSFLTYARTAVSLAAICQHFKIPNGGGYTNAIVALLTTHAVARPKFKPKKLFVVLKKECPQCKKEFIVEYKTNDAVCCSHSCSNSYFHALRYSKAINEKRRQAVCRNLSQTQGDFYEARLAKRKQRDLLRARKSLMRLLHKRLRLLDPNYSQHKRRTGIFGERVCHYCKKDYVARTQRQRYCSPMCVHAAPEIRSKIVMSVLQRVANGTHSGWKARGKHLRSYPEKFFDNWLTYNSYTFTPEVTVGKYFVDTVIILPNCKIALEIDGKQHWTNPARRMSDLLKQNVLVAHGYHILRIPWRGSKNVILYLPKLSFLLYTLSIQPAPTVISLDESLYPEFEDHYEI